MKEIINNNSELGLSIDVGDELSKDLTIHKNVKQEIIVTTTDKIRLVLMDTKETMLSQRNWLTPFGLLISFAITLCTADFKEAMSLSKDFWLAVFVLLLIGCCVWFIITIIKLIKNRGQADLDKIIERIKLHGEEYK